MPVGCMANCITYKHYIATVFIVLFEALIALMKSSQVIICDIVGLVTCILEAVSVSIISG